MRIVLIGSGNMATQLGKAFVQTGQHEVIQVYSRTLANANALANVFSTQAIDQLDELTLDADLYLIAVADSAISTIAEKLPKDLKGTVVHCSGATCIEVLKDFENYGVIYPIQSISKQVDLSFQQVPLGVEASSEPLASTLIHFLSLISERVFPCDSNQRLAIHVGAVFANNFSNALFQVTYDLLKKHDLPFDLLRPIILETANKVQNHIPQAVQTGPALRNDELTMEKHLQFISANPDWQLIYQQISSLIKKRMAKDM